VLFVALHGTSCPWGAVLATRSCGAGDRDRTGMTSLEDRAAIKMLTPANGNCGSSVTGGMSDRC
jgi:hypothetical protein